MESKKAKWNLENFHFENIFITTNWALYANRAHPFIPKKDTLWWINCVFMQILTGFCLFLLSFSLILYDIPDGHFFDASKNAIMVIVAVSVTLKYLSLLYYRQHLQDTINFMNNDFKQSFTFPEDDRGIVISYAIQGNKISIYWLVAATLTSIIFPIKALSIMGYYLYKGEFQFVPTFTMRYPDRLEDIKNTPFIFWFLFITCVTFGNYAATVYIGFDPLVPIFLLHICGQLDILSKRIVNIFSDNADKKDINEKFKQINLKLQELYRICHSIKVKYTILFEFNLKTTTFLLPLAMFQVVEGLREQRISLEFLSFCMSAILHFYLPCYYSDKLMERSENLREAIYSCGWEKYPDNNIRKTIMIMMTRTILPLGINTIFYPICLDTFAEMCRQAYTIFNLMNAAWS